MYGASVNFSRIYSTSIHVKSLIKELKCADALKLLYGYHKNEIAFWVSLKKHLISTASNYRESSFVALLLECSAKNDLSQSMVLVPGFI